MQHIARNRIIEPFEGRKSLETVQKTRGKIEKSISHIKKAINKTGDWVAGSGITQIPKTKLSEFFEDFRESDSPQMFSEFLSKLENKTKGIKQVTQNTYADLEQRAKIMANSYIKKGLELLIMENDVSWILNRANRALGVKNLTELEQIRRLSSDQREVLISSIYPYDSKRFQDFSRKFDLSVNIGLGVIVATNIPGTGIAISLINMAKTLVKLGNRLKIMSASYGYHLEDSQALFKVAAAILESMADWENNEQHVPLDPEVLDPLYSDNIEENQAGFREMIDAIVRKDAYIAIPGVGSISLGKINLDDVKMDLAVKNLVIDYFSKKELLLQFDSHLVNDTIKDFMSIYQEFKNQDYFKVARRKKESQLVRSSENKWKEKVKIFAGTDRFLDEFSADLDGYALDVYNNSKSLNSPSKERFIKKEIETILDSM